MLCPRVGSRARGGLGMAKRSVPLLGTPGTIVRPWPARLVSVAHGPGRQSPRALRTEAASAQIQQARSSRWPPRR